MGGVRWDWGRGQGEWTGPGEGAEGWMGPEEGAELRGRDCGRGLVGRTGPGEGAEGGDRTVGVAEASNSLPLSRCFEMGPQFCTI